MAVRRAILISLLLAAPLHAGQPSIRLEAQWNEESGTPRLLFDEELGPAANPADPQAAAREYLLLNAARFGLPPDLANLRVTAVRQSLIGSHVHFQQIIGGVPVEGAEIIVSIDPARRRVHSVFSSLDPAAKPAADAVRNPAVRPLQPAWKHLRAHGDLIVEPSTRTVYRSYGGELRLVNVTRLSLTAPFGHWEVAVDASNGQVLEVRSVAVDGTSQQRTPERGDAETDFEAYGGPLVGLTEASQRLQARRQEQRHRAAMRRLMPGSALVFDPDPRTALASEDLDESASESELEAAYVERTLPAVSLYDSRYWLEGPNVDIADAEPPSTPPSTTLDGHWRARRGESAFDDAMAHYHLDEAIGYLQQLGFATTSLLALPLEVDTDGADGADRSYFVAPSLIVLGRGCVADAEDAEVVVHELGHAIQLGCTGGFAGGDTGAVGEGFGDYWAGAHSLRRPKGTAFHPEWVFKWNAHNSCLDGRAMDLDPAQVQYDPQRSYGAHEPIEGGRLSDELWSTPLFAALEQLLRLGVPQGEVDRIVVEAHFGLGWGTTMRDLALSTVAAAQALYPQGPHAGVFQRQFARFGILEGGRQETDRVAFTAARFVADEGAEAAVVTVRRSGLGDGSVRVRLKVEGGTATAGEDFVPGEPVVSFADGEVGEARTVVHLLDDQVAEGDETVDLELEVVEGSAEVGDPAATVLLIHEPIGSDGLTPRLALPVATHCPLEGGAQELTRLLLTNPWPRRLEIRVQLQPAQGLPDGNGLLSVMVGVDPGATLAVPDVLVQRFAVEQATAGALLVETRPEAGPPLALAMTQLAGHEERAPEPVAAIQVDGKGVQQAVLGGLAGQGLAIDLELLNLGSSPCGAGVEGAGEPRSFDLPPWGVARAAGVSSSSTVRAATASGAGCPLAVLVASRCAVLPDPTAVALPPARRLQWLELGGGRSEATLLAPGAASARVEASVVGQQAAPTALDIGGGQAMDLTAWLATTAGRAPALVRLETSGAGVQAAGRRWTARDQLRRLAVLGEENLVGAAGAALLGVSEEAGTTTDLVVANVGTAAATAEVELLAADGRVLGSRSLTIPASAQARVERVASALAGAGVSDGVIVVRAHPGDLVLAWAVLRASGGDEALVEPLRLAPGSVWPG